MDDIIGNIRPAKKRNRKNQVTSPFRIAQAEKEVEIIDQRKAGKPFAELATEFGYADPSGPQKVVQRALEKYKSKAIEEYRAQQTEYTQQIIEANIEAATTPIIDGHATDPDAVNAVLKAIALQAKIVGTFAPNKFVTESTHKSETVESIVVGIIEGTNDQFLQELRNEIARKKAKELSPSLLEEIVEGESRELDLEDNADDL